MKPVFVNIVGAGLAGLSAARELANAGVPVRLLSAQASERAQSVLAEGGINAALDIMGEHDTVEEHFADTMRGGVWLADPNAVWGLVSDAPGIVRELAALGVPFQREGGAMIQRNFGGQKKKRTAYAQSSTGKVLVTALVDEVRRLEARGFVQRMPHAELVRLCVHDGRCGGVVVRDAYTGGEQELAGPVILANGGMGGLFGGLTTGTTTNNGDVAALAFAAGIELANLEFLQYHPTTVPITGKRLLVSEAARGEGGRLYVMRDGKPWYFMEDKYPELGNLMPRDVVSREEEAVLADPACGDQIFLDLRELPRRVWRERLADMHDELEHYLGIDAMREPVPVEPGIHYCMGGVLVDEAHRTNVEGLLAAGECACAYHGANRLGGNSLLGAIRGGREAARTLLGASLVDMPVEADKRMPSIEPLSQACAEDIPVELAMREALVGCMGITRTGDELRAGLAVLEELAAAGDCSCRMRLRLQLAQATVSCALAREESRGAHQRRDFPETREEFRRTTVVHAREIGVSSQGVDLEFRPLPEPREGVPRS